MGNSIILFLQESPIAYLTLYIPGLIGFPGKGKRLNKAIKASSLSGDFGMMYEALRLLLELG